MLLAALNLGSARAQFTLTASNAGNTATVAVAGPAITSLDLTGDFTTNFLLVNSDGTQTYASNATISVSGPDGLSFSSPIIDSGTVPVGSGYTVSSHETAFSFDIALTPAQETLFQSSGQSVTVTFSDWSTTGPSSNVAFFNWDVANGNLDAVPEPPTAWLAIGGFGALALVWRQRRRSIGDRAAFVGGTPGPA